MATVRFNTNLDEHILAYLDSEAKRIGISRGGMITFMIEKYRNDKDAMDVMNQLPDFIQKINSLEKKFTEQGDFKNENEN